MEILFHGCMPWVLGQEHYAKLGTLAYSYLLVSVVANAPIMYLLSYSKALEKILCESVETFIRRTRRSLFTGAVASKHNGNYDTTWGDARGAIRGRGYPGSGRSEKNWLRRLSGDLQAFQATNDSTEDSLSIVAAETALWTTTVN